MGEVLVNDEIDKEVRNLLTFLDPSSLRLLCASYEVLQEVPDGQLRPFITLMVRRMQAAEKLLDGGLSLIATRH